jgi:uncharacterized protein (DUF2126 family)/transglutaminase-like putative cysteine protease
MSIQVALEHQTSYHYDRRVRLGPQVVRLRPAPHCRTPILSYSLTVEPAEHFINWQQDPFGNHLARLVFPEPTRELIVTVDLIADLTVINPFDFFVDETAREWPFRYEDGLATDLTPYLAADPVGPLLREWLGGVGPAPTTIDFLVEINRRVYGDVAYSIRMDPGVQTPEETLTKGLGSCRDSAWLLVQILRNLGIAARFASGYLVQLKADIDALDGPRGPATDFTDLHAWAEAYLPGAGWVGLDPTSGLMAGEGHLPLACTPRPSAAAPISGEVEACETTFEFSNVVRRLHEDPRVTLPYTVAEWERIDALGHRVDELLTETRLTMGGEPTFVSIDDMEGAEWNIAADGAAKRALSVALADRLATAFAPGALIHHGQGKWYPGEPLPRWQITILWRADGTPLWADRSLLADPNRPHGAVASQAASLASDIAEGLGLPGVSAIRAGDGFVLPLHRGDAGWEAPEWPAPLELIPGDSPIGLRLPLSSLGEGVPTTALCVEVRDGNLFVFLPPVERVEDGVELIGAIERAATTPLVVEGYVPPGLAQIAVTPDPGVIEVNIHPSASWDELAARTLRLAEEARTVRLGTEKFALDGTHTGTGGGSHLTLGGRTVADSPLLRRPDLLPSLLTFWQHHPSLSYLFSGRFIGPTSQAPRVDEARHDTLYELEIAFAELERLERDGTYRPWHTDRLLRHLLVDITGNTHRAEFCIDKLFSPDSERGRLGLVELRGFEMPPHPQMALVQALLVRALVARFWADPYAGRLIRWGTELHDRFLLPWWVEADIGLVVDDLRAHGIGFDRRWLDPFLEFRFPRIGAVDVAGISLELRLAIEPWHVLGEEMSAGATARYVDSSVERLQVRVDGAVPSWHTVTCNRVALPLHPTASPGTSVAGVRYKAWQPPSGLHPTIGVHAPLVFDVIDNRSGHSLGGCTYHVVHPGGRNYERFPVNANEAEARRNTRFTAGGHTAGPVEPIVDRAPPGEYPRTLDLRRFPTS